MERTYSFWGNVLSIILDAEGTRPFGIVLKYLKLLEYFNKGLGIYIWGDNDPFYADANALGKELLGVTMKGNDKGDKTLTLRKEGEKTGLTADHAVTTAIENLYEGITIASLVRRCCSSVWLLPGRFKEF
eukprot:1139538-Pelagomonas_calceolata.AAC.2